MPLDSDGRTGRHNRPARLVMTAFLLSGDAFLCVDVPFNEVANRAAQYGDDHFTPGSEVRFPCASDFSTQLMNTVVFSLAHYVVKTSRRSSSKITLYSFERPDPLKSMGWTVLKRFLSKVHKGIIDKRRLRRLEAAAALAQQHCPGVSTVCAHTRVYCSCFECPAHYSLTTSWCLLSASFIFSLLDDRSICDMETGGGR